MANTKKKTGHGAKKAAAPRRKRGIAADCDGQLNQDAQACKPAETVEASNARNIKAAQEAFDQLKEQVDAMLAAAGYKVYRVKDGQPLPEELQAMVDATIQMGLRVATGERLNAGEALHGFVGWLLSRKVPIHLCNNAEAPPVMRLLREFMLYHGLPECRPDWDKRLVRMTEALADEGNSWPLNLVALTREQATNTIMGYLLSFGDQAQNAILARVITDLKERRETEYNALTEQANNVDERKAALADAERELIHVLRGDFTIVRE